VFDSNPELHRCSDAASNAPRLPRRHQPKQHRCTAVWDRIRREMEIERRMLTITDPYSPRIRPTLAPVGWTLR
jgi:hypothetical protein